MTLTMTAYATLITLLAISIVVNIILISFCNRVVHWAGYWKTQFEEASKPIKPVTRAVRNAPDISYWKDEWD